MLEDVNARPISCVQHNARLNNNYANYYLLLIVQRSSSTGLQYALEG